LNAVDGMLARQFGQKSALGGLLNEVGDVICDAALYLPFATLPGADLRLVVAAVLLAVLTEFVGVCAVSIGASRRYDGPMGKSDRAFAFGALALWAGVGLPLGSAINWPLAAIALLLLLTCAQRARMALREVRS
jgi:CDP-diacylglycerol--glycerol-3-phosphate 3-phosphatidyltransferase